MLLKTFLFLLGTVFLIRWQNLLIKLRAEKLRELPSSFFLLSPCVCQTVPNPEQLANWNWYSPFLTGLVFRGRVGICHCCVACSVWHRGGHLLLPLTATHQQWLLPSLSLAGKPLRNVITVGVHMCAHLCWSAGRLFLLSSLGMGWVFPTENMESELCAKIVGFQEQSYCVLLRTIGLEQHSSAKLWKLHFSLPVTKPPQFVHYQSIFCFNHMPCFCHTLIFPRNVAFFWVCLM